MHHNSFNICKLHFNLLSLVISSTHLVCSNYLNFVIETKGNDYYAFYINLTKYLYISYIYLLLLLFVNLGKFHPLVIVSKSQIRDM